MMLQLNPSIAVSCKSHGDGDAIIVIDYGLDVNTVWVVRFPNGEIKHFYSDDIRIYGNPMEGRGWDVKFDNGMDGVRRGNRHIKNQRRVRL